MDAGLLSLGLVKAVSKFHLDICLPRGQLGKVNIYDISDKYSELLNAVVASGELQNNVTDLKHLFRVGQVVRCFLKNSNTTSTNDDKSKTAQEISLNPRMVNKFLLQKFIRPNTVLIGAVESEEDHGYIIDCGLAGVKGFLAKDLAGDLHSLGALIPVSLVVNDPLEFMARESSRILSVKRVDELITGSSTDIPSTFHFGCFLPGMLVNAVIHSKVSSTLVAKIADYNIAISRSHYTGLEDDYHANKLVTVCVLTVDPGTKQLTGSLLPHLLSPQSARDDLHPVTSRAPIGLKLPRCLIERVDKRSLHLKVQHLDALNILIRKNHIPTKSTCDNLRSVFKVGSEVECRVIDHDLLENVAIATMNKKLLRLPYLSVSEVKPGDKLKAVVIRFTKTGIVVRVEDRFSGLIPYLHLADVQLKKPHEKFKAGDEIDCRALVVDVAQNKLLLTAKRGLVESAYPIFGHVDTVKLLEHPKDHIFTVFIVKVSERGILVAGVGEMRAWLPRRETGLGSDDALEATFFCGQVLHVRVLHPLTNKLGENEIRQTKYLVSLKFTSDKTVARKPSNASSVRIGEIFGATVTGIRESGLIVDLHTLQDGATTDVVGSAFLAFEHLSDSDLVTTQLAQYLKKLKPAGPLDYGGGIRDVVVINRSTSGTSIVTVSAKRSLVRAARKRAEMHESPGQGGVDQATGFVGKVEDLQVGSQWFAWVLNHVDYGIFVQFPAGIRGLAPTRLLCDVHLPKKVATSSLFPCGSTVVAKVVELAPSEKRRCLVSLRMMDTYFAEEHYVDLAMHSLNSWLSELQWISHRHEFLGGFRIGDLVTFQVKSFDTQRIVGEACKLQSGQNPKQPIRVPAVVLINNAEGVQYQLGTTLTGVVSYVDHVETRLEVALSTWIVHAVENRSDNPASLPRAGQKLRSVTLAFYDRLMAVVAFRGHALGHFGVVPARRMFNDVTGGSNWVIGQKNQVTLRNSFKQEGGNSVELYLCTLTAFDPIVRPASRQTWPDMPARITDPECAFPRTTNLTPGTRLSGLVFNRLCGHTAFFNLPTSAHPVFARLINLYPSAKEIRAFQSHPPASGSTMERTAVVLASATEDKHGGSLNSHLTEISFLEKPHVEVGDMVCAQLTRRHQSHWSVNLPGGAHGCLHITGMVHSKHPQPLTLQPGGSVMHTCKGLGSGLKKDHLVTCRIVDRLDNQVVTSDSSVAPLYFVSTRPDVVRGGLTHWEKLKPVFDVPTEGFVTSRSPKGLVVSVTHLDDLFVPFTPELRERVCNARLRFRVGDHLCVRPLRLMMNRMLGELVLTDQDAVAAPSDDIVEDAMKQLLELVANKAQKNKLRGNFLARKAHYLEFIHDPRADSLHAGQKRSLAHTSPQPDDVVTPVDTDSLGNYAKRRRHDSEVPVSKKRSPVDSAAWDIANTEVIQRYAEFLLPPDTPAQPVSAPSLQQQQQSVSAPQQTETHQSAAHDECRLLETETRNAMLAALTCEQKTLPKGHMKPTNHEEFELAVRNAPSNAACWTAYMTYVLSRSGESNLPKARNLAERGLRAIGTSIGLDATEADLQRARLLSFYLIMEAKELERLNRQQELASQQLSGERDSILAINVQAERLSDVLTRLVNLDQVPFIRRAIDTLADIGQFDRAEELAKRLIKSEPSDMDRWISLVKVRFRAGRIAAAREAQRNGSHLVRQTNLVRFLISCARLEVEFGDVDRAFTVFREQLTAHPKQRLIYEQFISSLLSAGKRSEAQSILEKARTVLKPNECTSLESQFELSAR